MNELQVEVSMYALRRVLAWTVRAEDFYLQGFVIVHNRSACSLPLRDRLARLAGSLLPLLVSKWSRQPTKTNWNLVSLEIDFRCDANQTSPSLQLLSGVCSMNVHFGDLRMRPTVSWPASTRLSSRAWSHPEFHLWNRLAVFKGAFSKAALLSQMNG